MEEDSLVIKSPERSAEIDEENGKVKAIEYNTDEKLESDLVKNTSKFNSVDDNNKEKINENIKNRVEACEISKKDIKLEILCEEKEVSNSLPNEKIDSIDRTIDTHFIEVQINKSDNRDKEGSIVEEDLKDNSNLNNISELEIEEKKMTKPLRSRMSCKKTTNKISPNEKKIGKSIPAVKNPTRKVLAEKQIRSSILPHNRPTILLRSSRSRSVILENSVNLNKEISSKENKITEIDNKNGTDCENGGQSTDEKDCNSSKENIVEEELEENSNPLNVENENKQDGEKIITRKSIPYESLSLMDKILIREHKIVSNMRNEDKSKNETDKEDGVLMDKGEKHLGRDISNGECISGKNDIVPKKRYHRRKCSAPFKNERIQTRQSRSITLMQNKNEFKYLPQVLKTEESDIPSHSDIKIEKQEEEGDKLEETMPVEDSGITRIPDVNITDQSEEKFTKENENSDIGVIDEENNRDLENKEDPHALNFAKNSPGIDEIPGPCKDEVDDSKSTAIAAESKISPKETGSPEYRRTRYRLSRKRESESGDENPKCRLRHINAQSMPIYTSRIAVKKNGNKIKSFVVEGPLLPQKKASKSDKSSDADHGRTDCEKAGERLEANEKETQNFFNNISLRSKTEKTTKDPKFSYFSNTDSEDTLSNVESVPNSPAQETWPRVAGKNLKLSNKSTKFNSGQSNSRRKDTSLITHKIPSCMDVRIMENDDKADVKFTRKRKHSEAEISSTSNCDDKRERSELRYYVETSENENPAGTPEGSEQGNTNGISNDDLGGQQETPWLRHYERPQKTLADIAKNDAEFEDNMKENSLQQNENSYHQQRKDIKTRKKNSNNNTSIADNSLSSQSANSPSVKKRGRPRKQDTKNPEIDSEGKKKTGPSVNRAKFNGSGLTKLELERLFFKFLQHGHFRIEPEEPIVIPDNGLYQKLSARMQCWDPRTHYMHPHNIESKNNTESSAYSHAQQNFPTDNTNEANRFYSPNNPSSGQHGNRLRTMHPNAHNFTNKNQGQTSYPKNLSPCNTNTNLHSYTDSANSFPNYNMQSGYGTASNYHQNFYSNNENPMVNNNSYSNSYSGIVNTNVNSINDMNASTAAASNLLSTANNFDDDLNFVLNPQHQHENQNSIPYNREMDLTINNNGNTVSSNSTNTVQTTSTNTTNPEWNLSGGNQHLDSVNGILMDLNSINDPRGSNQPMNGNSDLNNLNSTMNGSNPWMNRSNNMMNPRFQALQPWHASLPMYNSYLNNGNPYYNNMFNPYTGFMGFDLSNYPYGNMNSRNGMGINNENSWTQNMFTGSDGQSPFNTPNTEFSNMNSGTLEENRTSNQGMNLSVSSAATIPRTNSMELDDSDLVMGHGNGLNPNTEQREENTFAQIETKNNNDVEKSARGYGDQLSLPYTLGYKNDEQDLDFNNVEITNIDDDSNDHQQDLSEIQDYMNQTSDDLEACVNQNYTPNGSPNCEIIPDLPINRETEMSKLRQELADFTRQYSEDQTTSPTSHIQQADEMFI